MRDTRTAQTSIFDFYPKHETGRLLERISQHLDEHPVVLDLISADIASSEASLIGRRGMTIESILRCMLLKQIMQVSYESLAFHLADSFSYSTFARIDHKAPPSRSTLQSNIRRVQPETLSRVFEYLTGQGVLNGEISLEKIRLDSTVTSSPIASPSDSKLLTDCVRVLCRLMKKSADKAGFKVRFDDHRKAANALNYRIFHAKKPEKDTLYPELIRMARDVVKQAEIAVLTCEERAPIQDLAQPWMETMEHFIELTHQVIDQTERRVLHKESVPASEKIVSIFEPHTDIIVKAQRGVQYGHKLNLATDRRGYLTYIAIEKGNPADASLYLPALTSLKRQFGDFPKSTVADGGYASQENVKQARSLGVKQAVFHKTCGLTYTDMGVKKKTFDRLKHFRAGVEANISHLKRSFGLGKAMWKKAEGFSAYVYASAIAYNLIKRASLLSG